mmetsp:Transcript_9081/g.10534  ORF Transcript_9081/g.10534 Transcript_9081/m.10534 type:complete len:275 (-) Transcript_9081:104-928(-)
MMEEHPLVDVPWDDSSLISCVTQMELPIPSAPPMEYYEHMLSTAVATPVPFTHDTDTATLPEDGDEDEDEDDECQTHINIRAGAVAAIVTFPLFGPLMASIAATATAFGTSKDNKRQISAGALAMITSLPVCGPLIASIAGVATAYGTTQPGLAGDISRAVSDVAMTVKDKAIEVNGKHNIVGRSKKNAQKLIDKGKKSVKREIKKVNGDTNIVTRSRTNANDVLNSFQQSATLKIGRVLKGAWRMLKKGIKKTDKTKGSPVEKTKGACTVLID